MERREPVLACVVVRPAPQELRRSLERVDSVLVAVEDGVRRRVRLLLGEVIGRSSELETGPDASIEIEVVILPSAVRIEVSGDGLLMPSGIRAGDATEPTYPFWILEGLVDRWATDRRARRAGMWFLLHRPA